MNIQEYNDKVAEVGALDPASFSIITMLESTDEEAERIARMLDWQPTITVETDNGEVDEEGHPMFELEDKPNPVPTRLHIKNYIMERIAEELARLNTAYIIKQKEQEIEQLKQNAIAGTKARLK